MKKIAPFLFMLFASCTTDPGYISVWDAFKHCLTLPGFVIQSIAFTLVALVGAYFAYEKLDDAKTIINQTVMKIIVGVLTLIVVWFIWFKVPSEMSANTTKESAARGNYLRF